MTKKRDGGPRVLFFDIETTPNLAWIWKKYEQNAIGDFVKERHMIVFAWKWMGEKKIHALSLPMFPRFKKDKDDNTDLVKALHRLFSEADIVVGHNLDWFDVPMANVEFIGHGMNPPSPYKTVDTLKVARREFRFNSNKLGDLGKKLGFGDKAETGGFSLWTGCIRGDLKAYERMAAYCKRDVGLLEKIYYKLRPWMRSHPDMNALDENVGCPHCRHKDLMSRGWAIVGGGRRKRFVCKRCHKWSQGRFIKSKDAWKFR